MNYSKLLQLLKRNNIDYIRFEEETYNCMLISIFEVVVKEISDSDLNLKIRNQYRNSQDKILTTKNIVQKYTNCIINDEEAKIIYQCLNAYFTKTNIRTVYDSLVRTNILNSQNNHCNICGATITLDNSELDHVVPWTLVGDELGVNNLQLLCKKCNRHKSKSVVYNLKMFLVNKNDL